MYVALKTHGYNAVELFDLSKYMKPDIVYLALHGKGGEDAGRAADISFDELVSKIVVYGLGMRRDLK